MRTIAATIRRLVGTAGFFSKVSLSGEETGASNSFFSVLIRLTRIIGHFSRFRVANPAATPKAGAISWQKTGLSFFSL